MHIAFVFTKTTPGWDDRTFARGLGGTEAAMVCYSRAFARRGHDVWCFVPHAEDGCYNGVNWRGSYDRYTQERWDAVVSCRWPGDLKGWKSPIRALLANDQDCPTLPEAVFKGWCNQIITISEYQTNLYKRLYPAIPSTLYFQTSAGVEFEAMLPQISHEGMNCLYSSTPERGLERLLKLWPAIHEATGAQLYISSGFQLYGWDQEMCDKYSASIYKQATDSAHYVGPLYRKDYLELLARCDVMTYPSIYAENCCIAALEAAASGMPIITTPIGALSERVVDGITGYLVESDDAFVSKTIALLTNQTLARTMGAAARNLAAEHDYCILVRQWEERWTI